jgi:hypothetical protein
VREITTFFAVEPDRWRRSDEVHRNVLVDVAEMAEFLAERGLEVSVRQGFGAQETPEGLDVIVARAGPRGVGPQDVGPQDVGPQDVGR